MIQHKPWRGAAYRPGGLMLWGFSHHRWADEPDAPDFTISTIKEWAFTEQGQFFNAVKTVCGGTDPLDFWNGVAFANTLPEAVVDDFLQ